MSSIRPPSATSANAAQSAPQTRLAQACAEADRLQAVSDQAQARLRDARRARGAFERESRYGLALADPRRLAQAKQEALHEYRENVRHAADRPSMLAGTAAYLRAITRLNRTARSVAGQARDWTGRQLELDQQIRRLELTSDAARVAAETARSACIEARRQLVRHDEAQAAVHVPEAPAAAAEPSAGDDVTAIEALLAGDRAAFQSLVARLAEEVGLDASRLQLLLLELRHALHEEARAAAVLRFPATEFWAQFTTAEARAVAGALELLNRGFDGRAGWLGGRVAEPREVAIAVSMAGREPRLLRVRPTRADLDQLWRGTAVDPVEYVRERSPDLALETFEPLVGGKAAALAELWDNWGRLRRLMLSPASPA